MKFHDQNHHLSVGGGGDACVARVGGAANDGGRRKRLLRISCIIFILLFSLSACGGSSHMPPSPTAAPSPIPGTITIGKPYQTLPGSFLGFSIELSDLCAVLSRDAAEQQTYEQLYTAIGPGILRIGGNSADTSTWSSSGAPVCSNSQAIITPTLETSLFAFASRIHWRVIWALPLLNYNPANAAQEAASIAHIGGTTLLSFAIGNEPELYGKRFASYAASWNPSAYLSRWETEYRVVKAAVPHSAISGPDTSSIDAFFTNFSRRAGPARQVALLTAHYYTRPAGGEPPASIAELLSTATFDKFAGDVTQWMQTARSYHLPFALTEVNSISDSGVPGISDTDAAAFWLASTLLYAAAQGITFVGVHEATSASYNVIEDDGQPSVLYHALQLVHQVIDGAQLVSISGEADPVLQVMATRLAGGTIQVALLNHDPEITRSLTITPPVGTAPYALTTLAAPALNTTSHVRLATQSWTDNAPVLLNPDSLVVLTFRP